MLKFKNIEINDCKKISEYLWNAKQQSCCYCFTDLFIWRYFYKTQFCIENEVLYLKHVSEGKDRFHMPINKDGICLFLEPIYQYCKENNKEVIMSCINEDTKVQLEEKFLGKIILEENRDSAEYLYLTSDLIQLKGKKFHKKKNLCNRFMSDYEGRWRFDEMTKENIREIFEYHINWCDNNCYAKEDMSFFGEACAVSNALKNFDELGMKGGILRVDNKIIAYSLACPVRDDTVVVQIEKADNTITGAYQMINREFLKNCLSEYEYVNREEDLGIEGLRKAKLSYNPLKLIDNYTAKLID